MASVRREQQPPVDPDAKIPAAVTAAGQRADAAQRQALGLPEPQPDPATPPPIPQPDGGSPAPAALTPNPLPPEPPQSEATWEQRYKTDFGRLEADRKRFRETSEQMANRITQLEQQLVTAAPPAPRQPQPQLQLTPDEVNDYGEDFISMIQRIAQHAARSELTPLAEEVGRTRAQVGVQQV